MPVITIQTHEIDKATRKDLIDRISVVAAETIRVPEGYFTVFVDEYADDCIGCGGKTREELKTGG
ncbi:MAG: 4-oxalocrotonate tautomerase [Spirochaetae bacterium HGW-Spirochaetae-3]|jgi:phenylpyruvate tautomerase PptA (4-oxalocrotonate tautomerase family)|nr:MAG: 4-oxalocrotonate tautomerase [Spirochaetae bacterium HGW-Spirochaetae-3]